MTTDLVIIGAGGFAREALDVVEAVNAVAPAFTVLGVVDDGPSELALQRLAQRGYKYIGSVSDWLSSGSHGSYVVAIGSPSARASVVSRVEDAATAATLIHPSAVLGSEVRVLDGTIVCAGVQVSTNVSLGRHVHLNPNATIGHDAELADFVSINPGAVVSGEVTVGPLSLVGAGGIVLQGLSVGEGSTVGAGACVIRDVGAHTTVVGVPAAAVMRSGTDRAGSENDG